MASLGTDTGGSIRQPGALCGIPAMMGSYGRVSRYGLIAFASSLDRIGPFANNVKDVATVLQTIAGRDPNDSTSTTAPVPVYTDEISKPVKGLRIGIPRDYFAEGMDLGVRDKVEAGHRTVEEARLRTGRHPHAAHGLRHRHLLHHRDGGGQLQPGALRRRPLRLAYRRSDTARACTARHAAPGLAPR